MQCHLNGVHINEVSKFLTESPSETTHAIEVTDPQCPLRCPINISGKNTLQSNLTTGERCRNGQHDFSFLRIWMRMSTMEEGIHNIEF